MAGALSMNRDVLILGLLQQLPRVVVRSKFGIQGRRIGSVTAWEFIVIRFSSFSVKCVRGVGLLLLKRQRWRIYVSISGVPLVSSSAFPAVLIA